MPFPTPIQQKAITTKGNVLVSAAAGSGKTAVLTERVVSMLKGSETQKRISADRLLIVTFTNAAAAEMRARIEKKLNEEIQKDPKNKQLIEQKYLLPSADISTIDSFCIRLLRENFEKCDIEPDFKIIDNATETVITQNILSILIDEALVQKPDELKILLELTKCEYNDENLRNIISDIQLYINQLPNPMEYIEAFKKPYQATFDKGHLWYDKAFEIADKSINDINKILPDLNFSASIAVAREKALTCSGYAADLVDEINMIGGYIKDKDWNNSYKLIQNFAKNIKKPSVSKEDEEGQHFNVFVAQIKEKNEELKKIFYDFKENIQATLDKARPGVELLVELISELDMRLLEKHQQENSYTFYNIEQKAFKLLSNDEYADELSGRYDEVLVDEFQDVNDLQDSIFNKLSADGKKLFVVGDVKQSIYGFRGSNPKNFTDKRDRYIDVDNALDDDSKKVILSENFRSRKGICDAVNFFFSLLMAGQGGGIVYNEDEHLVAGNDTFPQIDNPCCDLLVVDKPSKDEQSTDDDQDSNEEDLSNAEFEAKRIAEYILSVMQEENAVTDDAFDENGNKLKDKKIMRRAKYDDFAILLAQAKSTAPVFVQTLNEYGIPVSYDGGSFLESYEIAIVMSLLQVIDNPKNSIELLNIMMTPLFGFTADEVAVLRAKNKDCTLYASLLAAKNNGDKKAEACLDRLSTFRNLAAVLPIDRLISQILHSTDLYNQMSALPGGKTRRNNLQLLIGYAKSYYDTSGGGIYGFIRYMNSLTDKDFKITSPQNGVKIMTMHGSKGLQFPICIIASLSTKMNKQEADAEMIHQKGFGIAFRYFDNDKMADNDKKSGIIDTVGHRVMKKAVNARLVEEKLRLLYVAMTRAVDRLCLVCRLNDYEKKIKQISEKISNTKPYLSQDFIEKTQNMGEWILAAMLLHPCGQELRNKADCCLTPIDDPALIAVELKGSNKLTAVLDEKAPQINNDFVDKIKQNIKSADEYDQKYGRLRLVQAKASVTSIVHGADDDKYAFTEEPAFIKGNKLTGASYGSAMHHIMQFIEFTQNVDVKAQIDQLYSRHFITEQEKNSADEIAVAKIEKFFKSDIYARILKSGNVNREMRFLTEKKNFNGIIGADIIVQGAVDLCFEEDGQMVVLDFKTDRVDDISKLKGFYAEQLNIYAEAVEKIFNKRVKEKIIYSLHLGESISF